MHPRSDILGLASFASGGVMDPRCLAPENYYTRITRPPGASTPVLALSLLARVAAWAACGLRAGVEEVAYEDETQKKEVKTGAGWRLAGPPCPHRDVGGARDIFLRMCSAEV